MRVIKRDDKILSISHLDADGVAAQIVLGNVFKNIEYINYQFVKIDEGLPRLNFSMYDHVFITDIYPAYHKLMDISDKFILLDHHETARDLHCPAKMRFVDTAQCGAALTKLFVENYFKIKLSHLDRYIFLINDYDLWNHTDPFSRKFNFIYDMYRKMNKNMSEYRKRFMTGNVNLTPEEIDHLASIDRDYKVVYDGLEIMEFEHIKGGFVLSATRFLNELCHDLMKNNGYNIVFIRNTDTGHISVRHNMPAFNAGEFLTKNNLGGGHKFAAGMSAIEPEDIPKKLLAIEKFLYVNFPEIRKSFMI